MENLKLAHKNAKKGKGWYKEVQMVDKNLDFYLKQLQDMFINNSYKTSEYKMFKKKEGNKIRTIYKLPYFPDRIAQWAIIQVIEPYLLKTFTVDTYSSIPNMGIHKALGKMKKAMYNDISNTRYCLKLDIKHFYQNIDHSILKEKLKRKFKDQKLLKLLFEIIDSINTAEIEDLEEFYRDSEINYNTGIPIGNYLSQYFGNLYLSDFDHLIKEKYHIKYYFRYMDDICIFHNDKIFLHQLKLEIEQYFKENHLTIKSNWQIFLSNSRGIDFVGYRVFNGFSLLRKSTCLKFKRKMRMIIKKTNKNNLMNYNDWCSISSYIGWLIYCDSNRLILKYICPLLSPYERYYNLIIRGEKNVGPKRGIEYH